MRSRISLYLNDLSLDEILYLEEELERRKERYRRNYAVLSVQTDPPVLRTDNSLPLAQLARDLRRYMVECAAVGGGTVLAYTPEVCLMLFHTVDDASRTCAALLAGLAELNGRGGQQSYRIGLKLGMASGTDTLAAGSSRCVRKSPLIRRANQCSWRSANGMLMLDEHSYREWPAKDSAVRVPVEVDGHHVYRVHPGLTDVGDRFDNEPLKQFLEGAVDAGIQMLKYTTVEVDTSTITTAGWGTPTEMMELSLEAYDTRNSRNLVYAEKVAVAELPRRMEVVKRIMSQMGLALVRYDSTATAEF